MFYLWHEHEADLSIYQFYPLIKEHLLKKPLAFANTFVNLSETNKLPTIQEKHQKQQCKEKQNQQSWSRMLYLVLFMYNLIFNKLIFYYAQTCTFSKS